MIAKIHTGNNFGGLVNYANDNGEPGVTRSTTLR